MGVQGRLRRYAMLDALGDTPKEKGATVRRLYLDGAAREAAAHELAAKKKRDKEAAKARGRTHRREDRNAEGRQRGRGTREPAARFLETPITPLGYHGTSKDWVLSFDDSHGVGKLSGRGAHFRCIWFRTSVIRQDQRAPQFVN